MSEFWKRTLSGAVYVAVVVGSILWHPAAFGILFLVLGVWGGAEFHQLMHSTRLSVSLAMLATALLIGTGWLLGFSMNRASAGLYGLITLVLYGIVIGVALLAELWAKEENPIHNWGNMLQSQTMIAFPFALMPFIGFIDKYALLAIFVLIWVNDSFAYCVGVLTAKKMPNGNHKMFPRVSPKKSWEGLIGGIVFTIGAGALLAYFGWFNRLSNPYGTPNPYLIGMLFAFVVSIFGTLGDLMESLFKRTIGVKDSGRFLPGHGGVLDRFDSVLLAAPATLLFMMMLLALGW